MSNQRIMFSKEGKAKYISHLDLMRTMQRAFIRAGVKLRHTEGFNPHPYMTFALPLSVGAESICELMDFELADETPFGDLPGLLTRSMPEGITVIKAYEAQRKFNEISWLEADGILDYDRGGAEEISKVLNAFFDTESLVITKRSKKGLLDFDIMPHIKKLEITADGNNKLIINTIVNAQNPPLNPELLVSAIKKKCPELSPDFSKFRRICFLDKDLNIFK